MASISEEKYESVTDRFVPNIWYTTNFNDPSYSQNMRISEVIKESPLAMLGMHKLAGLEPRFTESQVVYDLTYWSIPEKIDAYGRTFIRCVVFKNGTYYDMIRLIQ